LAGVRGDILHRLKAKFNVKSPILFKIILGAVFAIVAVLGVVYVNLGRNTPVVLMEVAQGATSQSDYAQPDYIQPDYAYIPAPIQVYVSGHVYNPGVFEFEADARIWQAIEAAGGMTAYADKNAVNLAATMVDEQHIIVFGIDDNIAHGGTVGAGSPAGITASGLVNINTATSEELQTLSQIGPSRAQNIINHRQNRGGFATIYDILNVSGIGEGIFEVIRDNITVD
jgi:competence protein ComEA